MDISSNTYVSGAMDFLNNNGVVNAGKYCYENPVDCREIAGQKATDLTEQGADFGARIIMSYTTVLMGAVAAKFAANTINSTFSLAKHTANGEFAAATKDVKSVAYNVALGAGFGWITYLGLKGCMNHEQSIADVRKDLNTFGSSIAAGADRVKSGAEYYAGEVKTAATGLFANEEGETVVEGNE